MNVTKGRGYVYSLQYHIAWCTRYRQDILNSEIRKFLSNMLYQIAHDNKFQIMYEDITEESVYLILNCTPQHYIPDMLKALKGVSARFLLKEYGTEIKGKMHGEHLWNPSYLVLTESEDTVEQIADYIQSQKKK